MLNKIIDLGISKTEALELIKVSKDINKDYDMLLNGYPIQYLIGYVNFYGNKIKVNKDVLIPRFETELLVEKSIKLIRSKFDEKINVLDLCTGSGAIAVSLLKEIDCVMTASDISVDALNLAKENANINDVKINFINSNLFENITGKFDFIISNPPYISYNEEIMESVKKYEPNIALFADDNGLEFYEKILFNIKKYLNDKFIIAFEIGYRQADSIVDIVKKYFNDVKIIVDKDYSFKDRYIFIISE